MFNKSTTHYTRLFHLRMVFRVNVSENVNVGKGTSKDATVKIKNSSVHHIAVVLNLILLVRNIN